MNQKFENQRKRELPYEKISPFELKNKLLELASGKQQKSARILLDAGRGNPNWIAATPREAFFALGQFAVSESQHVWNDGHLAGKPSRDGVSSRFDAFCANHGQTPGVPLLHEIVDFEVERHGFERDHLLYELVDGIIGDNYPVPDRMLIHMEKMVRDFIVQELCGNRLSADNFNLFAVEGATAAMCYIFETLLENHLLNQGDKIAIMVPIFPPYIEIPQLHKFGFDVVEIHASGVDAEGDHTWQYPQSELNKLKDTSVKALFLVNPSNPPSVAIQPESIQQLIHMVREENPELMIITDDVYSTFVDDFISLMAELPYNTIGVYSFSKYFGVTGWRLGVICVHDDNVFDERLKKLPHTTVEELNHRYASLSQHPEDLKFVDRLVADSRQVALNHTAGLSTPQQVQMALFSAFAMVDKDNHYKQLTKDICRRRMRLLYDSLKLPVPELKYGADYYTEIDLGEWSLRAYGQAFTDYLKATYDPIDILFRLAENASIVLLNGGGFRGPTWSIRVSLANLDDAAYTEIGVEVKKAMDGYQQEWKDAQA
jgi:aspartate 4-decarboxylase